MRTRWAFTVTGGKVSRFETGQAWGARSTGRGGERCANGRG